MAGFLYNRVDADLGELPRQLPKQCRQFSHVSIGDMHGNALKLIYILIEEGILELHEKKTYFELHRIYKEHPLTQKNLERFKTILDEASIKISRSITLIGDLLADRGNNDYFTLLILEKLFESHLDIDITLSNHDLEFIRNYEHSTFTGQSILMPEYRRSLNNLLNYIQTGIIQEENVRDIMDICYIHMLKAITYTVSTDGNLSLFMHAPVGLETIEAIAQKLNIPYQEETIQSLIHTINIINHTIQCKLHNKELTALIDEENGYDDANLGPISLKKPLTRLLWNRFMGTEVRTQPRKGNYRINLVSGHIGGGFTQAELQRHGLHRDDYQTLDTLFCKIPESSKTGNFKGLKVSHYTRQSEELTSKQLTLKTSETLSNEQLSVVEVARLYEANRTDFLFFLRFKSAGTKLEIARNALNEDDFIRSGLQATDTLLTSLNDFFGQYAGERTISKDTFYTRCTQAIQQHKACIQESEALWKTLKPYIKSLSEAFKTITPTEKITVETVTQTLQGTTFFQPSGQHDSPKQASPTAAIG